MKEAIMKKEDVWLVGCGQMAMDYIKVLETLEQPFKVIGRGEKAAALCEEKTGHAVTRGGLSSFLDSQPSPCGQAIVAVNIDSLAETTIQLIHSGVKKILVEKPAGLNSTEIQAVQNAAESNGAKIYVAYNRRCFSSVVKAKQFIAEDGGVTSFMFEFTELSRQIANLDHRTCVKEKWFLANSTHVVDLAFYLGGKPVTIESFTTGGLDWHPSASIFAGAGVSEKGALFSYMSNWESAGRWGVEICTRKRRLIFRPMEKLQVQELGKFTADTVELEDNLDANFKPGLFRQVDNFLNDKIADLCTIEELLDSMALYNKVANYSEVYQQP